MKIIYDVPMRPTLSSEGVKGGEVLLLEEVNVLIGIPKLKYITIVKEINLNEIKV